MTETMDDYVSRLEVDREQIVSTFRDHNGEAVGITKELIELAKSCEPYTVEEIALDIKRDILTNYIDNGGDADPIAFEIMQRVGWYSSILPEFRSLADPTRKLSYLYWTEDYIQAWRRVSARGLEVERLTKLTASELRSEIKRLYTEYGMEYIEGLRTEALEDPTLNDAWCPLIRSKNGEYALAFAGTFTHERFLAAVSQVEEQGWENAYVSTAHKTVDLND